MVHTLRLDPLLSSAAPRAEPSRERLERTTGVGPPRLGDTRPGGRRRPTVVAVGPREVRGEVTRRHDPPVARHRDGARAGGPGRRVLQVIRPPGHSGTGHPSRTGLRGADGKGFGGRNESYNGLDGGINKGPRGPRRRKGGVGRT